MTSARDPRLSRRRLLRGAAAAPLLLSPTARALSGLERPTAPRAPHREPNARSVIVLFQYGGVSHVDTFDHKPALYPLDGKTIEVKTRGRGGAKNQGRVVGPKWGFQQYGQCGRWVSDLFPHLGRQVDRMAFLHGMHAESPIHGSAMLMMNSGQLLTGHPCLGSWVEYGLGSPSDSLPGHVVMLDQSGGPISGAVNWSAGYMPASFQGVVLRSSGSPILDLDVPPGMTPQRLERLVEQMRRHDQAHLAGRSDVDDLRARMASYELALRMMRHAPAALDWTSESAETQSLYGIDQGESYDYGRKCLLARRLVERGVRYVQIYAGGAHDDQNWDAHGDLAFNHNRWAARTDKPIAGLLEDLARRGLLDETLVVWTTEFGRQPTAEYESGTGRDHNAYGFTIWMAGGGIPGGVAYGATDELGSAAVEGRTHVRDLHATILWHLGLEPNELTFRHAGLDRRLVGVAGADPIPQLM